MNLLALTFGDLLFFVLIVLPVVFLWVAVLVDILRRPDLSGVKIAVWLVVVIVLPLLGALVYFIVRPGPVKVESQRQRIEEEHRHV